jgi:hypothetical protein
MSDEVSETAGEYGRATFRMVFGTRTESHLDESELIKHVCNH